MNIVITADSEIDYHVTIIDYDGTVHYYFVDYKVIDDFIDKLKEELKVYENSVYK